jgi:hypothetical protein
MQLHRFTTAFTITATLCLAVSQGVARGDAGVAGSISTASDTIDLSAPVASNSAADPAANDSSATSDGSDTSGTDTTTGDQQSGDGANSQPDTPGPDESSGVHAAKRSTTAQTVQARPQAPPSLGPKDDLGALSPKAKRKEHDLACDARIRNAAFMSRAHADLMSYDAGGSWTAFAAGLGLAAALLVGAAFSVKRRAVTRGRQAPPAKGMLETAAVFVGICGGIAALGAQFIPGVGVHARPAPAVEMAVRKVDARITRAEFARALRDRVAIKKADRSELGNVVWVALHIRGYKGRPLAIDYGPYVNHALVGKQKPMIDLPTPATDDEATVLPIWIPYPSESKTFQAQFRLLDRKGVREIVGTGDMRGPKYRYACPRGR